MVNECFVVKVYSLLNHDSIAIKRIFSISNLVRTTRFWNNLRYGQSRKVGKPNNFKRFGNK
jgi:hypothetical protein